MSTLASAAVAALLSIGLPGPRASLRARLAEAPRAERRLDLGFQGADVKDVLRVLAEAGGVSVVVAEGVTGRVSVQLHDARWADAVAAVLESRRLGAELDGTILFVDTLERLAQTDELRRTRVEAAEALAPLVTRVLPVSHARAAELAPLVRALLTERGRLLVDERTNTLVVTDVAEVADRIRRL